MPERSRHCEGSEAARMSLGRCPGKAQPSDEPSQENCLLDNHRLTCDRWEGDSSVPVCAFVPLQEGAFLFEGGRLFFMDDFPRRKLDFTAIEALSQAVGGGKGLKKSFFVLVIVVVCLLLTACRTVPEAAQGGAGSYTVTDSQGTVVTLPAKPHRIVTLSMSTDEVMLGLVPPEDMAAVNGLLDDPVSSNVVELAKKVEKRVGNPTVEELVALSPDLVIVPDWGDLAIVPSLREAGLTVVVCKGARNLAEIKETIVLLAQATGVPERGEKLLAMMDEHLKGIEKKVSAIPESERKTVVLISLMSGYGGIGSSFDDACRYAGVRNGRSALGIRDGQVMTKEQLVEINPDILFVPTTMENLTSTSSARNTSTTHPCRRSRPSANIASKSRRKPTSTTVRRTSCSACRKSPIAHTETPSPKGVKSISRRWNRRVLLCNFRRIFSWTQL